MTIIILLSSNISFSRSPLAYTRYFPAEGAATPPVSSAWGFWQLFRMPTKKCCSVGSNAWIASRARFIVLHLFRKLLIIVLLFQSDRGSFFLVPLNLSLFWKKVMSSTSITSASFGGEGTRHSCEEEPLVEEQLMEEKLGEANHYPMTRIGTAFVLSRAQTF